MTRPGPALFSLIIAVAFSAPAYSDEGTKPYTPTRLEWLAASAQVSCSNSVGHVLKTLRQTDPKDSSQFTVTARAHQGIGPDGKFIFKDDTLFITGNFQPDHAVSLVTQAAAKMSLQMCKGVLQTIANAKGWTWLKFDMKFNGPNGTETID